MQPYDSCRLLHHNLTSYVKKPFTDESYFDFDEFKKVAYEAAILGDNLVDLELEHITRILNKLRSEKNNELEINLWQKVYNETISGRRMGIGFTGLSDAIAMLGINLDSPKAWIVIEDIMKTKMYSELNSLTDLAIIRGSFNGFNKDLIFKKENSQLVGNNRFYEKLVQEFPIEADRIYEYGIRSVSWSTVAPTGTVSLMAQTSSGIEPVFMPYYFRKKKVMSSLDRVDFIDEVGEKFTEYPVLHPLFKYWIENIYFKDSKTDISTLNKTDLESLFEKSPWFGSTAPEIDYEGRIIIQNIVQEYTTHSISSTVNLPEETTEKIIDNIYREAHKHGLKGITVYRDGSRSGILTKESIKDNNLEVIKRPKELKGISHNTKIKGENHTVLIGFLNEIPYEVFIFKGSIESGSGKIIKSKKRTYKFIIDNKEFPITDIMNEEEATITRLISMSLRHGAKLKYIIDQLRKSDSSIISFTNAISRVLSKYVPVETGNKCPNCGGRLIKEAGCEKCLDCDHSKCLMSKSVKND